MVSTLSSLYIFTGRSSFMGARGVHKRLHGCCYSYNRVLTKKIRFDTNVGLLLFLHVTPFQPSPISLLRVHLNGIRNVTIHINVPKNYEFHTNVGRLRQILQNITCTYDLANGIARNNRNRMQGFC